MEEQDRDWIRKVFLDAADHFVDRALATDPKLISIAAWEVEHLREGREAGLVDINGSFFGLSGNRKYSLFTLNREYLTHIAEYVRLITQEGHDRDDVKFEFKNLDIVVFDNEKPLIGIEVKTTKQRGNKLITEMLRLLPEPRMPENDRGNDPIRKIKSLLEIKPPEFRVVTPTATWRFSAEYPSDGQIILSEIH